jgi:hypothetical protein
MISHFAISALDLIAIRRFFEWLMKIKISSISILFSFSKFSSITTFASIIILNRFLWCVNNVETIAFIKLKTMRFEIIDHFFLDFSDVFRNEFDLFDQTRNLFQFVSEDDRVDSTNDHRFQVKIKCFYQVEIFWIIDEFFR